MRLLLDSLFIASVYQGGDRGNLFCFMFEPCWVLSNSATNLELSWKTCGMELFASASRKGKESRVAGCGFLSARIAQPLWSWLGAGWLTAWAGWAPTCLPKPMQGWLPGMGGKQQRQE